VNSERTARKPRRRLAGAAVAAGTTVAVLAGGGTTALAARAAPAGGIISTVAGGVGGPGPATAISLVSDNVPAGNCGSPEGAAGVAAAPGRLYIADGSVRQVSEQTGTLTTPAGTGAAGPLGLGGPAAGSSTAACGVAADHAGNLVIADPNSRRLLLVAAKTGTFYGQQMTAGHIYAVAGDGGPAPGGTGVPRFSGDGGPATSAGMWNPTAVQLDSAGNLLIADQDDSRIRVVAVKTGTFYGRAMKAGHIYTVAGDGTFGFAGDGGPATKAELGEPAWAAADHAGNLLIADSHNERVRVVAASTATFYGQKMTKGNIYTVAGNGLSGFAGDGGPARFAEFNQPVSVAVDPAGNIVLADTNFGSVPADMGNNRVRVVAARTGTFYGVPMTKGDIYTVGGNGQPGYAGDGHAAAKAELDDPVGVGVTGAGNLLVADVNDGRVREITR